MPIQIASLFAKVGADTSGLQKGLSDADRQLKKTKQETESFGQSLAKTALWLTGLGVAAKGAFELTRTAAYAQRAENSFTALSGSAEQAKTNLELLREVTRNTKTDFELMQGAASLMALGLAEDATQLGSIMKNVESLGSRFGGTMQIFQLMMSNQSLMRIDSFGIGVEEATKRIDEFKKAGMSAETAFKTAILELMEEKYTSLGGAVEDSALKFEQLTANFGNLKIAAGELLLPLGELAVLTFGTLTTNIRDSIPAIERAIREYGFLAVVADILVEGFLDVNDTIHTQIDDAQLLVRAERDLGLAYSDVGKAAQMAFSEDVVNAPQGMVVGVENLGAAWVATKEEMTAAQSRQNSMFTQEAQKALEDQAYAIAQIGQAWAGVQLAMTGPIKNENEQYNDSLTRSKDRMAELQIEIDKLERGHGALIQTKQEEALSENELALMVAKRSDAEYRLMVELAKDDKDENATVMAQMRVNIDKYNEALNQTVDTTKKYVDNTKKISELRAEYDEVAKGIDDLADAHDEATKRILFNMLSQRIAMSEGGNTAEAQSAMMALAEKQGLVDKATLDWWNTMDMAMDGVDLGLFEMGEGIILVGEYMDKFKGDGEAAFAAMKEDMETNNRLWEIYAELVGGTAQSFKDIPREIYITMRIKEINERAGYTGPVYSPDVINDAGGTSGGQSVTWNGGINVNGSGDPQSTANAVIQKLADRGIIHAGGYR